MATAEVAPRPPPAPDRPRRKPFANLFRNLTNLKNKGHDAQDKNGSKKNGIMGSKSKKYAGNNGTLKNNPYPQSAHLNQRDPSLDSSEAGNMSFSLPSRHQDGRDSLSSPDHDRDLPAGSNRSTAPTLATNPETVHSEAGNSKAPTTTTHGGALSSVDGAGASSTFSSARNSQHSLTTTLTTIQSTSPGTTLNTASGQPNPHHHGSLNNPNPVMFSHQYPVSPGPSTGNALSAIPRHLAEPSTYNSATANNLLSDNASILTLASSSKRRRRSMDSTDASVRALAPSSVWGGSRESLPLSVLSGNIDHPAHHQYAPSRPSISGVASAERASVYSQQYGPYASERNSYYSYRPQRDLGDAKSVRSITGLSLAGDARSVNADAKSLGGDVGSLKGYEGSMNVAGHSRNDSIPGSIGSPLASPGQRSAGGLGGMSRRSSDWGEEGRKGSLEEKEEREDVVRERGADD